MKYGLLTILLVLLATSPALAQGTDERPLVGTSNPDRMARTADSASMSPAQETRLADAVRDVRDDFASGRRSGGIGDLIGGAIIGGLGGYVAYTALDEEPADIGLGLFGLGIAGYGLSDVVSGIWKLAYDTPQERIADKLLEDPAQLRASGMLFLEQESYRARRARYVGGTLSIITGLSAGVIAIPLLRDDQTDEVLIGLIGLTAGLQLLDGVITLFSTSEAERRYEELESVMESRAGVYELQVVPTIATMPTAKGTTAGPGVAAGFRF